MAKCNQLTPLPCKGLIQSIHVQNIVTRRAVYSIRRMHVYGVRFVIYFISISKTNDSNKAPEQPIDMRKKKDNKAKVYSANSCRTVDYW